MTQQIQKSILKFASKGNVVGTLSILAILIFALSGGFGSGAKEVAENILNETDVVSAVSENSTKIIRVVDGDTLMIEGDEKIRLIGVDTPETVDPRKPVQCFGKEASAKTKELAEGKMVTLVVDESQGNTDKYGRLLRYVTLEDGQDLGLALLSGGFAHEYTYDKKYEKQAEYKNAVFEAENNEVGLWDPDACK